MSVGKIQIFEFVGSFTYKNLFIDLLICKRETILRALITLNLLFILKYQFLNAFSTRCITELITFD